MTTISDAIKDYQEHIRRTLTPKEVEIFISGWQYKAKHVAKISMENRNRKEKLNTNIKIDKVDVSKFIVIDDFESFEKFKKEHK